MTNYKQLYAIKKKNEERILKLCPDVTNESGIYIFTRVENGFKYAYVGQAKNLLDRLASHLSGYDQHIDLSIKKHKLYSEDNSTGWKLQCITAPICKLDDKEQFYIKLYADDGYQLRNKTGGSQGKDKFGIAPNAPAKGKKYRDGLKQGYKNAQKDVKVLFDKYLDYSIKTDRKPNKYCDNAMTRFSEFLK